MVNYIKQIEDKLEEFHELFKFTPEKVYMSIDTFKGLLKEFNMSFNIYILFGDTKVRMDCSLKYGELAFLVEDGTRIYGDDVIKAKQYRMCRLEME